MTHRKLSPCVFLSILLLLAACGMPKLSRPNVPDTIDNSRAQIRYSVTAYEGDLQKYKEHIESTPPNYERARVYRDRMINRIREQIELVYREYELKLAIDRARFETGSDIAQAGLTGAIAAVAGESLKTILGIALGGTQTTRLSISKNYFREKTTEIIITAMRGTRQEKLNQIIGKMTKLPVTDYTFEEARSELVEFFYAGTLQGALQSMAAEAGKTEVQQKDKAAARTLVRLGEIAPTTIEERDATDLIWKQLDELEDKNNVDEAKAVLNRLREQGVTITLSGDENPADIFKLLKTQIRNTITDKKLIPKLLRAFKLQ